MRQLQLWEQELRSYFNIKELVCKHVYDKFGEGAWQFLDERLLRTLHAVRLILGKPMVVNNWARGGSYSQRGLRCNVCVLVREKSNLEKVYLSAHIFGKAIDFHVPGMTEREVRSTIIDNQHRLPYPVRIERDTDGWIHIDTRNDYPNEKIILFNP